MHRPFASLRMTTLTFATGCCRWQTAQRGVVWGFLIYSLWENSHGAEFEFEEESGGVGRGEDGIDSAAVFVAGWIAFAGTDLGNGGASGAGAVAEGEVEGARGDRQLGGGEGRGHCFSLRETAGGGRRGAGDSCALE